jgi:ABC-type phosphate transport system substrate-binding protein
VNAPGSWRALLATAVLCAAATAARADVVVVVSAKSPIAALSPAEIADVFLGRLTRLPDGTTAVPIDQTEGSPRRAEVYSTLARMSPVQLKAYWSKLIFTGRGRPPRAVGGDEEVLRAVRLNPAAIGYVDRRLADDSVRIIHP